jgi:hypothetical protein
MWEGVSGYLTAELSTGTFILSGGYTDYLGAYVPYLAVMYSATLISLKYTTIGGAHYTCTPNQNPTLSSVCLNFNVFGSGPSTYIATTNGVRYTYSCVRTDTPEVTMKNTTASMPFSEGVYGISTSGIYAYFRYQVVANVQGENTTYMFTDTLYGTFEYVFYEDEHHYQYKFGYGGDYRLIDVNTALIQIGFDLPDSAYITRYDCSLGGYVNDTLIRLQI